jgi:hypothetical protein
MKADHAYELIFKDVPLNERPERAVVECGYFPPKKKSVWTDEMVISIVGLVSDEMIQEMNGQTKEDFLKACLVYSDKQ